MIFYIWCELVLHVGERAAPVSKKEPTPLLFLGAFRIGGNRNRNRVRYGESGIGKYFSALFTSSRTVGDESCLKIEQFI